MATKFMNIPTPNTEVEKKEFTPTVFTHLITYNKTIEEISIVNTSDYENVIWLGKDTYYGDVFKVWNNNNNINNFSILLGVKGDEEYK